MSDIEAVAAALAPYIEQAISDAVQEAVKRAATATPVDGAVAAVSGATASVKIAGQDALVPATIANDAIGYGDRVVVVFYGNGIAYAHGPIPGTPPPI